MEYDVVYYSWRSPLSLFSFKPINVMNRIHNPMYWALKFHAKNFNVFVVVVFSLIILNIILRTEDRPLQEFSFRLHFLPHQQRIAHRLTSFSYQKSFKKRKNPITLIIYVSNIQLTQRTTPSITCAPFFKIR